MTHEHFLRGYLMLTAQPWGKTYRTGQAVPGEPSPAEIQVEFYYDTFKNYEAEAWIAACVQQATGEHWPSVDALKLALRQYAPSLTPVLEYASSSSRGCTKEEFGLKLYETIKTIGGLLGVEQQRAAAIHYEHPEKMPDLMKRRKALQVTLAAQLQTLTNHELDQVLAKYPWVVGC
jgi:hypothetical protein